MDQLESEWLFACCHPHTHYMDRQRVNGTSVYALKQQKACSPYQKFLWSEFSKKWMNASRGIKRKMCVHFSIRTKPEQDLKCVIHAAMSTDAANCKNEHVKKCECVFVTGEGGLCLQLSCMLSARGDPPPLRIQSPFKRTPPPQKGRILQTGRKTCHPSLPLFCSIVHF